MSQGLCGSHTLCQYGEIARCHQQINSTRASMSSGSLITKHGTRRALSGASQGLLDSKIISLYHNGTEQHGLFGSDPGDTWDLYCQGTDSQYSLVLRQSTSVRRTLGHEDSCCTIVFRYHKEAVLLGHWISVIIDQGS